MNTTAAVLMLIFGVLMMLCAYKTMEDTLRP